MNNYKFGNYICSLREQRGLTQAELAERIGLKTISKGVKVQFVEDKIIIDLIINVKFGCNIVNTARNVQEKLIAVVQDTTGIEKADINVHVSGISFEK